MCNRVLRSYLAGGRGIMSGPTNSFLCLCVCVHVCIQYMSVCCVGKSRFTVPLHNSVRACSSNGGKVVCQAAYQYSIHVSLLLFLSPWHSFFMLTDLFLFFRLSPHLQVFPLSLSLSSSFLRFISCTLRRLKVILSSCDCLPFSRFQI